MPKKTKSKIESFDVLLPISPSVSHKGKEGATNDIARNAHSRIVRKIA